MAELVPILSRFFDLPWQLQAAIIGYFVNAAAIAPSLQPPGESAYFLQRAVYRLSQAAAGNYGQARNATDPKGKT